MKLNFSNIEAPNRSCLAAMVVCTSFALAMNSIGQVNDFYDPEESEKAKKANEKALEKMLDLPDPQPIEPNPSRYAGDDAENYVLARAAAFSMRDRQEDPFMLPQDSSVKPEEKKVAPRQTRTRHAALPPTPLSDIVQLIRVTTIMPSEKKFLIGVREFKESEVFPLQYGGKTLQIKVLEVTARRIVFFDIEKKEEATLEMKLLPPGMEAGGEKMQPPGMLLEDEDLPLQLGLTEAPNNPSN